MQVFKCAMRIMRASFAFPLIYVVGLSFMSVVLAFSAVPLDDRPSDGFERAEYAYSIIDRDNSTIFTFACRSACRRWRGDRGNG